MIITENSSTSERKLDDRYNSSQRKRLVLMGKESLNSDLEVCIGLYYNYHVESKTSMKKLSNC